MSLTETMYRTGRVYRWWNCLTGADRRRISATVNAETMSGVHDGCHALSPDEAIARLKEVRR